MKETTNYRVDPLGFEQRSTSFDVPCETTGHGYARQYEYAFLKNWLSPTLLSDRFKRCTLCKFHFSFK